MRTAEPQHSRARTRSQLVKILNGIRAECADADWDGYGAKAVSQAVVLRAEAIIQALPGKIPKPEISAEPDGQISFDWLPSQTRTFTLSVDANGQLAYAWIDGSSRGKGTEPMNKEALPRRLIEALNLSPKTKLSSELTE